MRKKETAEQNTNEKSMTEKKTTARKKRKKAKSPVFLFSLKRTHHVLLIKRKKLWFLTAYRRPFRIEMFILTE